MSDIYKRQNIILSAIYFFISRKKYIEMAVSHGMACNLEADDQKKSAEERGDVLLAQWERQYRKDYTEMTSEITSALWSSFWVVLLLIFVSFSLAFYFGSLSIDRAFDPVKAIAYVGSSLVGWAALMELGNDFMVWDGPAFPQLVHKVIFKAIFLPGVFFVLLSIVL